MSIGSSKVKQQLACSYQNETSLQRKLPPVTSSLEQV